MNLLVSVLPSGRWAEIIVSSPPACWSVSALTQPGGGVQGRGRSPAHARGARQSRSQARRARPRQRVEDAAGGRGVEVGIERHAERGVAEAEGHAVADN